MNTKLPLIATAFLTLVLSSASGAEPRVLVYQKNGKGFVHDNLAASAVAIRELGKLNGFDVDVSTNPAVFADGTLKIYQALIFANSNNEAFENEEQRAVFQRFIRGGGGFMGIPRRVPSGNGRTSSRCRGRNSSATRRSRSSPSPSPTQSIRPRRIFLRIGSGRTSVTSSRT